jgi:formylglycine-generating enzyme required for sulfatase activity
MKHHLFAGSLLMSCLAAPVALIAEQPVQEPAARSLPGMVRIPAGKAIVGIEQKQAEGMIIEERDPDSRWVLGGEVGRHSVELEEFFIAPTLVTNEMYLEYVTAAGTRPPALWAEIPKEMKDRLMEEHKQRDPAFVWDEGFQHRWWTANWQDPAVTWKLPPTRALEPVVFLTYEEALEYCRWAGLRLPSEEEFIRAGRGDGDQAYPFGKDFRREIVAHSTSLPAGLAYKRTPVAMFQNASQFGIFDLSGNVWEWTTSDYLGYTNFPSAGFKAKYKDLVVAGNKTKTVISEQLILPSWDPSRKVIKGGCFTQSPQFCRLDTRVGLDPMTAVPIVGFRVTASAKPVRDATVARAQNLRSSILGGRPESELAGARALGVERRTWPDMTAIASRRAAPEKPFTAPALPEAYRVFGPCEVIGVVPRSDPFADGEHPEVTTIDREVRKSRTFPQLAVFVTTAPILEPPLDPGSYVLAWMPSYKDVETLLKLGALVPESDMPKTKVEPDPEAKPNFDLTGVVIEPTHEHLLFVNPEGKVVAAQRLAEGFKHQPEKSGGHSLTLNLEKDSLEFRLQLPGRPGKSYMVRFSLRGLDADGKTLVRPELWTGDFAIQKIPPGAQPPAPIKPRALPADPVAPTAATDK